MGSFEIMPSFCCEQSGAAEFSSASTPFALFCSFCKIFPVLVKMIFDYIDNKAKIIRAEESLDLSAYFLTTTKNIQNSFSQFHYSNLCLYPVCDVTKGTSTSP